MKGILGYGLWQTIVAVTIGLALVLFIIAMFYNVWGAI